MKAAALRAAAVFTFTLPFLFFPLAAQASVHLASPNLNTLTQGLVGYWSMDGNTINWNTDTIQDLSGNGNTGALVGMSTTSSPVPGKIGGALKFGTSNQNITVQNSSSLQPSNLSVSVWIKLNTPLASQPQAYPYIVDKQTLNPYTGYRMVLEKTGNVVDFFTGYGGASDPEVSFGNASALLGTGWHQLTGTYNGSQICIYLDGVQQNCTASTGSMSYNNETLYIGDYHGGGGDELSGDIDDVRIYNRALSAQEVSLLYAMGQVNMTAQSAAQNGLSGSLTASWSFDSSTVSGSTVADQSGNGHDLTLENGASITAGHSGQALTLDGADDQYAAGEVGTLPTSVALSMWVKASDVSTEQSVLVEQDSETANSGYHFTLVGIKNGAFYAGFWDIGDIASTPISDNTWYHVILTYDGVADTQSLYVNGVLQGTQSGTWSPPDTIYFLPGLAQQGCSFTDASGYCADSATYFTGQIDDLQAYDEAFTEADVQALSNNPFVTIDHSDTSPNIGINAGLVGYWTFDGPTINWRTDTVADESGQGNTGHMVNMSTSSSPTPGVIGQALRFSGANYISTPSSTSLNVGSSDFSVSFWFRNTTPLLTNYWNIVGKKNNYNGGDVGWTFWFRNSEGEGSGLSIRFNGGQSNDTIAGSLSNVTSQIADGKWHFVVAAIDRETGTVDFYLDDTNEGMVGSVPTGSFSNTDPVGIGASGVGNYSVPNGFSLDEVRIYNRALSPQEIQQLYVMGR